VLFHERTGFDFAAMASSNWSIEDEKMFQQLAQRRTSQMPLPTAESSGAMTDASKRRFEDAEFEVDTESDWACGRHRRFSHKGFASSWCCQYGYVGKDQVCIWKV